MAAQKSPFFKGAFLLKGVHIMPGTAIHALLTEKKPKVEEAEKQLAICLTTQARLENPQHGTLPHPK